MPTGPRLDGAEYVHCPSPNVLIISTNRSVSHADGATLVVEALDWFLVQTDHRFGWIKRPLI
jgi:hypothetical protein